MWCVVCEGKGEGIESGNRQNVEEERNSEPRTCTHRGGIEAYYRVKKCVLLQEARVIIDVPLNHFCLGMLVSFPD